MFMCMSNVAFRAVSSGIAVIAVLRWAVFEVRSLTVRDRLEMVNTGFQLLRRRRRLFVGLFVRHRLYNEIIPHRYLSSARAPKLFSGVGTFSDLWKRIGGILSPEEVLSFKIVSLSARLPIHCRLHRNPIKFNCQNIRHK